MLSGTTRSAHRPGAVFGSSPVAPSAVPSVAGPSSPLRPSRAPRATVGGCSTTSAPREAKAWAATLSEAERRREKYQEMYAADAMTLDELRSKLGALEETRETARRELESLASWRESLQTLERDKELLLESYATRAPEALAGLKPEERRTVYSTLGLRIEALPDKSLRVRGAFGEESLVCQDTERQQDDAAGPAD